jgi:hypothetical protein
MIIDLQEKVIKTLVPLLSSILRSADAGKAARSLPRTTAVRMESICRHAIL